MHVVMVVGLGNHCLPDTRHSVGMLVVDCLAKQLGATWRFNMRSMGHLAVTKVDNQQIILLKPTVLMNINGKSIARTAAMYNVNPSNVILVHDDLDRPVGKYSLKHGGSAGGHNGVRSAIASLSSDALKRVRVGIGRPNNRHHVTDYVLSKFESSEIPVVQDTAEQCCKVLMDELQLIRTQGNGTKDTENSEGASVEYHIQQQSVT
ncbi:putative peptidyl-tRNA hydrolase isoform X2 [Oculina patagonica]